MSGPDSLEVALETRKKERKKEERKIDKWPIFEYLVLTCTIVLMNDLGLVRCTILLEILIFTLKNFIKLPTAFLLKIRPF